MAADGKMRTTDVFQLLLKECTIEAPPVLIAPLYLIMFQLLLKECTIEAPKPTD